MTIWQKNHAPGATADVSAFTAGNDRILDLQLAKADVLGSMAHLHMLASIGLITTSESEQLHRELKNILTDVEAGRFVIEDHAEDVHSQIEYQLTKKTGEAGKKIHSGRSRNDQVLVDLKLFLRAEIQQIIEESRLLFDLLLHLSEKHKHHLMPGYTHLQLAMPSSFGLWFGAYAESLVDDLQTMLAAYRVVNKNPLGSAAGYGSSFPINRTMTTKLLGFDDLQYNVVYAQMGRGKTERIVADALSNLAATLGKLAMDACLFLNQHFAFIHFPEELTTGSSIMPHKKNPDVFELIRAHANRLQALPQQIRMITTNLPSGYHRDLQLLKEVLFPAFSELTDCLRMTRRMLENIRVESHLLKDAKFSYLFSVEEVNRLVLQGVPFREAYRKVADDIHSGQFNPTTEIHHTHEGSIGNLCNDRIAAMMQKLLNNFGFEKIAKAEADLVNLIK